MFSNITSSGSAFIRLWLAWEAPSMSTTTRPLRVSLCKTPRDSTQDQRGAAPAAAAGEPSRKRQQQRPSDNTGGSDCSSYLRPGVPESHDRVDAAGGQEAVAGMRLETVHNGLVSLQHTHQVGGFLLPDEEGAVVRAADDVLGIARAEQQSLGRTQEPGSSRLRISHGFYHQQADIPHTYRSR